MSDPLEYFIFFSCIRLLMWLSILLNPLVLHWILFYYVISCLGSSLSDYVDVSPILLGFCRDPLDIMVVLVPFFLDLPQKCRTVFFVMICCATVHTCRWWEWTFPCIMEHYWSFASSKSSFVSSSTSIAS
jgi:hypothetical protein